MTHLLDTDTSVFWLRGHIPVRDRIINAGSGTLSISVITLAELHYGANCSSRPQQNHDAIDAFVTRVAVLVIDTRVARMFAQVKAGLRQHGTLLEDFDLLIAATALTQQLTLVTNNVGHFNRIPGLRIERWA